MSDFKVKMHQNRFRLGLRPRPHRGSLQRSPRSPSWNKGALLLREGKGKGRGKGKEMEGKGGKGGGEGEGRRGEGREGCRKREEERGKGKGGRGEKGRKEEEEGEREGKRETRHTNPNLLPAPLKTNISPPIRLFPPKTSILGHTNANIK